jgi:hypothetical protein
MLRSVTPPPSNFSKASTPSVSNQRQGVGTTGFLEIELAFRKLKDLNRDTTNRSRAVLLRLTDQLLKIQGDIAGSRLIISHFGKFNQDQRQLHLGLHQPGSAIRSFLHELSDSNFDLEDLNTRYRDLERAVSQLLDKLHSERDPLHLERNSLGSRVLRFFGLARIPEISA